MSCRLHAAGDERERRRPRNAFETAIWVLITQRSQVQIKQRPGHHPHRSAGGAVARSTGHRGVVAGPAGLAAAVYGASVGLPRSSSTRWRRVGRRRPRPISRATSNALRHRRRPPCKRRSRRSRCEPCHARVRRARRRGLAQQPRNHDAGRIRCYDRQQSARSNVAHEPRDVFAEVATDYCTTKWHNTASKGSNSLRSSIPPRMNCTPHRPSWLARSPVSAPMGPAPLRGPRCGQRQRVERVAAANVGTRAAGAGPQQPGAGTEGPWST
jgi:hypothetical protein